MAAPWASIVVGIVFIVVWSLFWKLVLDVAWAMFGEHIVRAQLDFEEWYQ
jgi:hypothetical protein